MRRPADMALIIMSRVRRAVLFDAGNTLLLLEHAAIVSHLASRGHAVSVAQVEDAELHARVRLDDHLAAGVSTESLDTRARYFRYILEPLGITREDEVAAIWDWRQEYNRPAGLYTRPDPDAMAALARIRAAGLVAGVISNSNGHAELLLAGAGLASGVDFVIDSGIVGVEKPDPRIFALGPRGRRGSLRPRRSTSATSTRWTCWARAPRGSTASSWIPAATGATGDACAPPASSTPCASRSDSRSEVGVRGALVR